MKWFTMLCTAVLTFSLGQTASLAGSEQGYAASTTLKAAFYSTSLQKEMNVNVYLPPNYDAQDKYPVLYVLHSYKLNEDHWFKTLQVTKKAEELIGSGKIEPMIIVAPEMDNSFGVNSADKTGVMEGSGKPGDEGVLTMGRYEDYLTTDVVNFVDTHFNTIKSRSGRYIGGTSMGGFAALHIGLRHPNLYSKVGGHAPAIFVGPMWDVLEKMIYPTEAARQANDPLVLATSQKLSKVSLYLDCGDQDDFKEATKKLRDILSAQKTKGFEFHMTPGGKHDDTYWRSQIENYLLFYGGMDRE